MFRIKTSDNSAGLLMLLVMMAAALRPTALGQKTREDDELSCDNDEQRMERLIETVVERKLQLYHKKQEEKPQSQRRPRDCADVMCQGHRTNGVYTVYVGSTQCPLDVYCDMTTDGGGWTVFQRRQDGSEDFYRNWTDYASGFGNIDGEFWLGNDNLSLLTLAATQQLRIDMADFNNETRYAQYSDFKVAPSSEKYKLISIGTYSGTAGDSMSSHQLGSNFSTFDQDNDSNAGSCATQYKGAWWYSSCHSSNLNGLYLRGNHTSWGDGVNWRHWTGYQYSLKFTEMKIRPADV